MMNEGIEVIRKLWADDYANYEGKYYTLKDAVSYPKPLQQPHPPIWMGTMEAGPKMLRAAVEHADGINIAWSFSPDVFQEKLQRIKEFCEEHGRDPTTLALSYGVWTRVFNNEAEAEEAKQKMKEARGFTDEQLEERLEGSLYGTAVAITAKLKKYIALGITHFIFMFPKDEEIESMKIFSEDIIPNL
jgi:alkanesulfonate monooxygenase SsuD/methylene tetrahydromethanopterin reductase-like flavin-dependent oxidoreductase (luciferase family)